MTHLHRIKASGTARAAVRTLLAVPALLLALGLGACHRIDDQRIPPVPVWLAFSSVGEWDMYGVPGALDHRRFIKDQRQPANYPYTAASATGLGGILLCGDINGQPVAYDLACPVECRYNVRIAVDTEANVAECPVCHSTYDVFSLGGYPLSGPAAKQGYGLRRYYVHPGPRGEYRVVTR